MRLTLTGLTVTMVVTGLLPRLDAKQQQPVPFTGGQQQQPNVPINAPPGAPAAPGQNEASPMVQVRPNYILGPNDQILIRAFQVEEIGERPYRIDMDGNVDLPLLGTVKAGGLNLDQLEAELNKRLAMYVRNPQVSVTVVQYRSEPVFFIGLFRSPGIYPLQGRRTLVDMLSSIGGLQPNASRRLTITRRLEYGTLPLPNAVVDKVSGTSTAEVSMGSLHDNVNPAEDIVLLPYDKISVARAEMVFVGGEVGKTGGLELGERDSLSVVQAISLSGGVTREADLQKAHVLRPIVNTSRRAEIPINLKRVFDGKNNDFPLMQNDLLYVPRKHSPLATAGKTALYWAPPLLTTILYLATR